jgi:hypothetical protein
VLQAFPRLTTIAQIRAFAHAQLPPATISNRGSEPPEFNLIVRAPAQSCLGADRTAERAVH